MLGKPGNISTVNDNFAAIRRINTADKVQESGLTGAATAQ